MKIAGQGFRYIGVLASLALLAAVFDPTRFLAIPFAVLAAFVAFFFRDPTRVPPEGAHLLVSPGDGRVVYAGPAEGDPERKQISIFLSIFDVHINRSPLTALVRKITYTPGRFLAAYRAEASRANERNEIELADGDYVVIVRQIAGIVARRIVCTLDERQELERGQRFGLIQFGSRMEVIFPGDTELGVSVGEHVKGGVTVIGKRPLRE